jgi:hypothetical protein
VHIGRLFTLLWFCRFNSGDSTQTYKPETNIMANFDVEAYYAEQDERMNLPDEGTGEFIKRVSSFRQRCVYMRH